VTEIRDPAAAATNLVERRRELLDRLVREEMGDALREEDAITVANSRGDPAVVRAAAALVPGSARAWQPGYNIPTAVRLRGRLMQRCSIGVSRRSCAATKYCAPLSEPKADARSRDQSGNSASNAASRLGGPSRRWSARPRSRRSPETKLAEPSISRRDRSFGSCSRRSETTSTSFRHHASCDFGRLVDGCLRPRDRRCL